MTEGPPMDWLPPSFQDLLRPEGQVFDAGDGHMRQATGCGILCCTGSARSAKTSLSLAMMDTVMRCTDRPLCFVGWPDVCMDALPDHWKQPGRLYNPQNIEKLLEIKRPAVVLLDDTAVLLNSRDAMTSGAKLMSRLAGVLSHIGGGLTVILTTQSMAGIDLSLLRFTQLAVAVRRMSPMALWSERDSWAPRIRAAQHDLADAAEDQGWRDVYFSLMDDMVCAAWFPDWLSRETDLERADKLSRPFRYMDNAKLKELILKPPARGRKRKDEEDEEHEPVEV